MKIMYIHAKANVDVIPALKKALPLLKGKVGIITTIQFLHLMKDAKRFLDSKKIKNEILGQVLGCNTDVADKSDADIFLYIGSGEFHTIGVLLKKKKKIIIADPVSNNVKELNENEYEKYEKIRYRGLAKFHSSKNIGVLVTTKPGQEQLKAALSLKNKYKDKNFYILLFDSLDFSQLENFPFIECFVNTMCPRIAYDDTGKIPKAVINYGDLE